MICRNKVAPVFLWLLLSLGLVSAELKFDSLTTKVSAKADQDVVIALFPFVNESGKLITITKVKSICLHCLSAGVSGGKVDKDGSVSFAPGEKGIVKGSFKTGTLSGQIEKKLELYLKGDADDAPSIMLNCEINIPELIHLSSKSLSWKNGDLETKKVFFSVAEGNSIKIEPPSMTSESFDTQWEVVKGGQKYVFHVTPKKGSEAQFAACYFVTNSSNPKAKKIRIYLRISKKE